MLKEISLASLRLNPMTMISDDWLLITAGTQITGYNTMTACWGQLGALWGHGKGLPTATVFIRPQRYTKCFVDREPFYSLCFFPKKYKKQLAYLGTHSGRDEDKVTASGLTPVFENGYTYFAQARLVLVCRKLYRAPLVEDGFIDRQVMDENYPERDFHDQYIGEIIKVLANTEEEHNP